MYLCACFDLCLIPAFTQEPVGCTCEYPESNCLLKFINSDRKKCYFQLLLSIRVQFQVTKKENTLENSLNLCRSYYCYLSSEESVKPGENPVTQWSENVIVAKYQVAVGLILSENTRLDAFNLLSHFLKRSLEISFASH